MMRIVTLVLTVAMLELNGEIVETIVQYADENTMLEGVLYYDDQVSGTRPGVLVIHEWDGLSTYAKWRAQRLAEMGYVAFAADMYGQGVRGKTHEEAAMLSKPFLENRSRMRQRAMAGYDVLRGQSRVDRSRTAAIGYCFGGTAALELARSGVPLKAVASFHGGPSTPDPRDGSQIQADVMVFHGADDPYIPPQDIASFMEEMQAAKIRYGLFAYPDAVHGFTVPEAGNHPETGKAYNQPADEQSWTELTALLERSLG